MLDVAITRVDGQTVVDLSHREAPALPVLPALRELLPGGLRRGSTVSVIGSTSLLLALLAAGSSAGAWCVLVGVPQISAEAALEYGIDLSRLALVPATALRNTTDWPTAVGALLDTVDVVVARPPAQLVTGDVRRLAARVRTKQAVLIPYYPSPPAQSWPGCDLRISVRERQWLGADEGSGRLRRRRLSVSVEGRGGAARPRSRDLWLPAAGGGVAVALPEEPRLRAAAS